MKEQLTHRWCFVVPLVDVWQWENDNQEDVETFIHEHKEAIEQREVA